MSLPVKILSVLTGLSIAGAQARVWTNDRGVTVSGRLVAAREADVDLKLQDGRVVTVPRTIFSGADQEYIQAWVQSGGTLADADEGGETAPDGSPGMAPAGRMEPNWKAPWPLRTGVTGFLLVKTVQETDELSVYETDHFTIEAPGKLIEAERQAVAHRFESALAALAAMPLNLTVARNPSRKYLVRICLSEAEMNLAPGLRAGRLKFSPTSFTVLLLRNAKGAPLKLTGFDPRFAVTHWVMQALDFEHWLVDGFSAYMSFAPVEKDEIAFGRLPALLASRLPRAVRSGRQALPALADMLARDASHKAAGKDHHLEAAGNGFWADLLWMVYLCHLEGEGKADRLKRYAQTWDAGETAKARSILLDGGTPEEAQEKMAGAWKRYGLKLRFAPPAPPAAEGAEAQPRGL